MAMRTINSCKSRRVFESRNRKQRRVVAKPAWWLCITNFEC